MDFNDSDISPTRFHKHLGQLLACSSLTTGKCAVPSRLPVKTFKQFAGRR